MPTADRKLHQLTVDELTFRISSLLLQDPALQSAVVRGEVAELKKHTSGHVYFTLLGKESRISCALFKNYLPYVPKWPQNGDEVLAEGSVSLYAPRGSYQLIVRRIVPVGKGAAERARLELQQRLENEGLFDVRLKRPMPRFPAKAAVVTSATGAALRDVVAVAAKRMPSCTLVVVPAQVQGYEAPDEIVAALGRAGRVEGAECVLLVRGGGSRDDLVPFDDERVVRAVRSCPLPLITGVGHEIDETLSDLAADVRAPTPSAAAERVFPDRFELLAMLEHKKRLVRSAIEGDIRSAEKDAEAFLRRASRLAEGGIGECASDGDMLFSRLRAANERFLSAERERLGSLAASLNSLSPLRVFDRGYSLCEKDGVPVTSAGGLKPEDGITIRFFDGDADAVVTAVNLKDKTP